MWGESAPQSIPRPAPRRIATSRTVGIDIASMMMAGVDIGDRALVSWSGNPLWYQEFLAVMPDLASLPGRDPVAELTRPTTCHRSARLSRPRWRLTSPCAMLRPLPGRGSGVGVVMAEPGRWWCVWRGDRLRCPGSARTQQRCRVHLGRSPTQVSAGRETACRGPFEGQLIAPSHTWSISLAIFLTLLYNSGQEVM